jgi:spermidine/putrescine transport system ATP-binding protein
VSALASIQNITMRYGATAALDDVSLDIPQNSYTVLLGPSGSGKTTLLSILGGFLQPTSGRVLVNDVDYTTVSPAKRPTATVFQDYALFPHMSVLDNVGFGLRMRGVSKQLRDARAAEMLATVGLPDAMQRKPHQLSGGQRQRVALARALVVEPQLLLLDEPLGALDLKLRRHMQDELKSLQQRIGTAFVHVTHDQEEAMALADHIVVMNKGRIEDQGTAQQVYTRPASEFSASFMGESTLIGPDSALGAALGLQSRAAIRPENIRIVASIGNLGEALVEVMVFQGSFQRVLARSLIDPNTVFIVRADVGQVLHPGDRLLLSVEPQHVAVLKA